MWRTIHWNYKYIPDKQRPETEVILYKHRKPRGLWVVQSRHWCKQRQQRSDRERPKICIHTLGCFTFFECHRTTPSRQKHVARDFQYSNEKLQSKCKCVCGGRGHVFTVTYSPGVEFHYTRDWKVKWNAVRPKKHNFCRSRRREPEK